MSFGSCLQSASTTYLHLAGSPLARKRHQIDYPADEPARKRRKQNPPLVTRPSLETLHGRIRQRDRTCKSSYGAHFTKCAPLYVRRDVSFARFQDQSVPLAKFGQIPTPRSYAPPPKFGQTSTPTSLPYKHTPVQPVPRFPTEPRHPQPSQFPRSQQYPQQPRPAAQSPQFRQPAPAAQAPHPAPAPGPVPSFQSAQSARPAQFITAAKPAQPVNPTSPAQPAQPIPAPTPYSSNVPDQPFCGKCGRAIGANQKIRDHKWKHVTITVKERGLYDILDIFPSATNADIRRAYLKQALQHHPDKNVHQPLVAHEKFKAVKQAYDILLDEDKRLVYNSFGLDYCLHGPPRDPPPQPAQPPSPPPPQQPSHPLPYACWNCTRTFSLYSGMMQHLETGNLQPIRHLGAHTPMSLWLRIRRPARLSRLRQYFFKAEHFIAALGEEREMQGGACVSRCPRESVEIAAWTEEEVGVSLKRVTLARERSEDGQILRGVYGEPKRECRAVLWSRLHNWSRYRQQLVATRSAGRRLYRGAQLQRGLWIHMAAAPEAQAEIPFILN